MDFQSKYCLLEESTDPDNKDKIVISPDTYAIGEMLEELKKQIANLRLR